MALDKFAVKKGIEHTSDATLIGSVIVPTGTVALYPGSSVPNGWVECNAQELSISTYPDLYNAITNNGTAFPYGSNTNGSGSAGSTHFRVPDLRGRVAIGSGTGSGLTARTLGNWGGAQSVTVADATIAHTHNFPHSHSQPHTHGTYHGQLYTNPNGDLVGGTFHTAGDHTHTYNNHTHPIGTAPGGHQHAIWFGNTGGPGTFSRRLQTTSGPLNATHANPAGTHAHGLVSNGDSTSTPSSMSSGDSDSPATGSASISTTDGPSASNTQPATGPGGSVSSISVVQKSYVLKYIMKV